MEPRSVILDTDIGTDVDDCLALALILGSPELKLAAVTTVYGDVSLRARMVLKLLALRGAPHIPVAEGTGRTLLGKRSIYWGGHEGKGLLEPGDETLTPVSEHAVDLIVRTVMERPGEITLLAIGPLTNLALAFLREPRLAQNLAGLCIMGGVVGGAHALELPWAEHNFRCDPEATHIVLSSGAPMTIVPLDVTTRVRIRPADAQRIRGAGDAFHMAIADQMELYPPFAQRGWTHLHDPLAVACVIEPTLTRQQPLHLTVETQGEHTAGVMLASLPGMDFSATASVALEVDAAKAEALIVERLTR